MKLPPVTDLNESPNNLVPFFDSVAFNQKASIAKYPALSHSIRSSRKFSTNSISARLTLADIETGVAL
jgi:hypothetical protein